MTRPSRGDRPIDVSMLRPPCDGAGAGAVAEVQHDDVAVARVAPEELGGATRDVAVRRAVEAVAPHLVVARATRPGRHTCGPRAAGVWWNAVSNTATCGTSGKASRAPRMPSRFAGLCSGASGTSSRIAVTTSSSTTTGSVNRGPPWTTRCPTAKQPQLVEVGSVLAQRLAGGVEAPPCGRGSHVALVGPSPALWARRPAPPIFSTIPDAALPPVSPSTPGTSRRTTLR